MIHEDIKSQLLNYRLIESIDRREWLMLIWMASKSSMNAYDKKNNIEHINHAMCGHLKKFFRLMQE